MKQKVTEKGHSAFTFEEFLQDDFFISSMKKPTAETLKYWEQFRKDNPDTRHFEAAKTYIESINRYHRTLSMAEIDEIARGIRKKRNRKSQIRRLLYWSSSAVAAACIALLMYFQLQRAENQQEVIAQSENAGFNQLVVPLGKRSQLNLPDGTVVWVNSGSRLIYPAVFADNQREIYVDGEIYLEVAHDLHRPFVVRSKNLNVQVLGTKFCVAAYEGENEEVVLVSGAVQVVSKIDETITRLQPEQMYRSENGQISVQKVDTRKYTSWIEGFYYCENENLGNIFQKLSRFYGVEITCDPAISEVVFSGKLDLKDNLSDIFEGIAFSLPISFSKENAKYIVSKIN